jgi:hypothetical protein
LFFLDFNISSVSLFNLAASLSLFSAFNQQPWTWCPFFFQTVHVMTALGTVVFDIVVYVSPFASVCSAGAEVVGIEVAPKVATNAFISAS